MTPNCSLEADYRKECAEFHVRHIVIYAASTKKSNKLSPQSQLMDHLVPRSLVPSLATRDLGTRLHQR